VCVCACVCVCSRNESTNHTLVVGQAAFVCIPVGEIEGERKKE